MNKRQRKKKLRKAKNNKVAAAAAGQFSQSRAAASSVQSCPLQNASPVPCNLRLLRIVEPKGSPADKPGTRSAEYKLGAKRRGRQCPVTLPSGAKFQITAMSKHNPAREVVATVVPEVLCSSSVHPLLDWRDTHHMTADARSQVSLAYTRAPMSGDDGVFVSGIWSILKSALTEGDPEQFEVRAQSHGVPAGASRPVPALSSAIEVFPADQYKFTLKVPPLFQPERLKFEKKSKHWETDADREKKAQKESAEQAAADADKHYEATEDFFKEAKISRSEVRDLYKDLAQDKATRDKADSYYTGYREYFEEQGLSRDQVRAGLKDESEMLDAVEVRLVRTDGKREIEAPLEDILKLLRFIREAVYKIKSVEEWINSIQVGPGASIDIKAEFLQGVITVSWGYSEYIDERVYLKYAGSLDIDAVRLSLEICLGYRFAGACDLLLVFGGEGALGLSGSAERSNPDEWLEAKVSPRGEAKVSGKLSGTLFWTLKGEVGVECVWKLNSEEFEFMKNGRALGGRLIIDREATNFVATASSRFFGFGGSHSSKEELIPGEPRCHVIPFGEA